MTTIVSSNCTIGHAQADGRRYINERHLLDDGRSVDFEYLADQSVNPDAIMTERAVRLADELEAQALASGIAAEGGVPLTHNDFRKRLSLDEQLIFDNFDVPEFASVHPKIIALDVMQRALVRTGLATYRDVLDIRLTDPDTQRLVGMLAAFGLLDHAGRAEEILNG